MARTCSRRHRHRRRHQIRTRRRDPTLMLSRTQSSHSAPPREALAAELGSVAQRIEREVVLRVDVALADIRAEMANLRAAAAEQQLAMTTRLAELRDGRDGQDGEPGAAGAPGPQGPGP